MTGAEFVLRCLRDQGLGHVFLVPGGHIDPLVAELGQGAGLLPIVAAHEEGAGFMANGTSLGAKRLPDYSYVNMIWPIRRGRANRLVGNHPNTWHQTGSNARSRSGCNALSANISTCCAYASAIRVSVEWH